MDMLGLPDDVRFEDAGTAAQDFYAHLVLTTVQQRGLLAQDHLARQIIAVLEACRVDAPGSLWVYVVLPDAVRLIVGPTGENALAAFVEQVKTQTTVHVINRIQRADDDTLDAVLYYNPVWGGAVYRLWDAGYHKSVFWTPYQLSNAIYALQQTPVEAGLVPDADAWPYTWIGGDTDADS
ncbi:MAG: hypothetical protein K8S97_14705 [Anaerolineae bacterium]|nr:hypothetical protein [Anaerolineae bacterium]